MTVLPAVICNGLQRKFGDVVAVDSVSFEVEPREFFALLGPNGAGKTTTLHMLTTMLDPSSGTASVHGFDVQRESKHVRNIIGMVFQEPALDDRLTAWENLEIHTALYGIPRTEVRSRIEEALLWASLENESKRKVRTFSGGMKRRLELARALMHDPKVLFMDEPTVGLDPQGRRHLWESIDKLRGEGLTVFMTTHYLQEAEACDRVGIIDHGKLIAIGSPDQLRDEAEIEGATTLEDVFIALTGRGLRDEAASPRARLLSFGKRGGEHTR
jgi:ABC-2 type transport system ATP-binding protein